MGYINKWLRNLIQDMKDNFTLPADWNEYLSKVEQNHNLIIKSKNGCYCTNCQQTFTKKIKMKNETQCPNCKQKLMVRSDELKNLTLKDNVLLLDKVQDYLVARVFELRSDYDGEKQEFEHYVSEYARKIIEKDYLELRNERIQPGVTSYSVNHWRWQGDGDWRIYTGYWYETILSGFLYRDNLKQVLKDTVYEHSRMWEMIRNPYIEYYNLKHLLRVAASPSFETLVELKLYNLADDADSFWTTGTFNKIFGVSKDFYEFMKKHNITKEQLDILKLYPVKNIRTIKFLEQYKYTIEEIKDYTSLDNFIYYFRKNRLKDSHMYLDYLQNAKKLGLDLKNKRYLFPKNLKIEHDKVCNEVKILEQELMNKKITKRFKKLQKNIFKNKKYIIIPASSVEDLIDESKQQNNCVRTYTERYADGNCDIYFMRNIDNPEKSLVTVEVRENKIVQKRTKNNEKTTTEQDKFLKKWEETVLNKKINYANERILEYAAG